jgi:hypothetical protein
MHVIAFRDANSGRKSTMNKICTNPAVIAHACAVVRFDEEMR